MLRVLRVPGWNANYVAAVLLGIWAMLVAVSPNPSLQLILLGVPCFAAFSWWVILRPGRWMPIFFLVLLLLPPLPLPWGDSGVHVAPLMVCLGLLAGLIRIHEWRPWSHPFSRTFALFLFILLESVCLAAVYSGWQIALGSLARVLLFGISGFVFVYTFAGPMGDGWGGLRMVKLLYWAAVAAAAFACLDFYFQFPAPGGFGEQFIYLEQGVLRRAQGLFYEASTLGNFCAFFLVMVAVCFLRSDDRTVSSRKGLAIGRKGLAIGGIILAAALMLSYSRASVLNVAVALCVLFSLRLRRFRRSFGIMGAVLIGLVFAGVTFHSASPALWSNYWGRLLGSFSFFGESPDRILSGRVGHWQILLDFLAREPWHALLGVGYKTLPYSNFAGSTVIADNTFLSLLVETGVVGLAAFIGMNVVILRTGWKATRSPHPTAAFLGEWIFCFWCGQIVQMLSGDLITYWRVWPVYLWVLGAAARETGERT
jgi:O-antigen ligase